MCQRAELAWRSPLRLSRWRCCLPLEASRGETPQSLAKVDSLLSSRQPLPREPMRAFGSQWVGRSPEQAPGARWAKKSRIDPAAVGDISTNGTRLRYLVFTGGPVL